METAWAYLVVSTSEQRDTLDHQRQWAEETASTHGWRIERVFSDATSGRKGVRKLLARLVTELRSTPKDERPSRVLMIRLDRVGRGSIVDSQVALREIHLLGSIVHTRDGGDEKVDGPMNELINAAKFAVASFENAVKAEKMRSAHARWKREGRHFGPPPYGTEKDSEHRLIVKEPQAGFVRKAFELRAAGAGYIRIARDVGRYAPPQGTYAGKPRSSTWHPHSVTQLLKCRSYRGLVVDEDLFDRVQMVRNPDWKLTRTSKVYPWPLSGILRCECGWTMAGVACGSMTHRVRRYTCRHPRYHGFDHRPSVRADVAEAWFLDRLRGLGAKPELLSDARRARAAGDVGNLREAISTARVELTEVERLRGMAWGLQGDGRIAAAELARRLDDLSVKRSDLLARIDSAERDLAVAVAESTIVADAAQILAQAADQWSAAPWDSQKEIARLVAVAVEGISFDGNRLVFGVDTEGPTDASSSKRNAVYGPEMARLLAALP